MIDSLVYARLTIDALASHLRSGMADWRVYPSGSLGHGGVPAKPETPYLQHGNGGNRQNLAVRQTRDSRSIFWDIFVYDNPGSFTRIRDIHDIIQDNMSEIEGAKSGEWSVTAQRVWNYGADAYDPVNRINSVRATYLIVAGRNQ